MTTPRFCEDQYLTQGGQKGAEPSGQSWSRTLHRLIFWLSSGVTATGPPPTQSSVAAQMNELFVKLREFLYAPRHIHTGLGSVTTINIDTIKGQQHFTVTSVMPSLQCPRQGLREAAPPRCPSLLYIKKKPGSTKPRCDLMAAASAGLWAMCLLRGPEPSRLFQGKVGSVLGAPGELGALKHFIYSVLYFH